MHHRCIRLTVPIRVGFSYVAEHFERLQRSRGFAVICIIEKVFESSLLAVSAFILQINIILVFELYRLTKRGFQRSYHLHSHSFVDEETQNFQNLLNKWYAIRQISLVHTRVDETTKRSHGRWCICKHWFVLRSRC
jgi:hypothetical protein